MGKGRHDAITNNEMGLLRASKLYDVSKSTLKHNDNGKEQHIEKLVTIRNGRKPVLSKTLETSLVSYCLITEKSFFGFTTKNDKRMALQLAIKNGISFVKVNTN
jgi:hypothetical protein